MTKKGVKKNLRKPSDRNIDDFVESGTVASKHAIQIPTNADAEYGTSSVHAPYEVLDELDLILKKAKRNWGSSHSRTSITRVFFYALVHMPKKDQKYLLSAEGEDQTLERLLEYFQK